jgi:hypothetical protein
MKPADRVIRRVRLGDYLKGLSQGGSEWMLCGYLRYSALCNERRGEAEQIAINREFLNLEGGAKRNILIGC